jgi:hypothetical protein
MDTKAVLLELAKSNTMTLVDEIHADKPDNITHWAEVVADVARQLSDHDDILAMEDCTDTFEQVSNPDSNFPYYKEKWEAMSHFTAWASTDLIEDVDMYCQQRAENDTQPDYLFIPIDGYLFSLYQSACLSILTYCQKLAGQA